VYAATGNSIGDTEDYGWSERVVRLTHALFVERSDHPALVGRDSDFGATPMLYQPPGCPPELLAKNKDGVLYRYDRDAIGHGAVQVRRTSRTNGHYQGLPAYSAETNMVYLANSSNHLKFTHGLVAFRIRGDCTLVRDWQQPVGIDNDIPPSPTVANGVVYYADASGDRLFAFDAVTGKHLWDSGSAIHGALYAAPMVVNGRLYVGSFDGHLYAFGV